MTQAVFMPRYAGSFACVGSACTDTCCSGWAVAIDRDTFEKWQAIDVRMPGSRLTERTRAPLANESLAAGECAVMTTAASGACACLSDEKLCTVQATLGEDALPLICSSFPRRQVKAGERVSMYLTMSCPEVARLALSHPAAMEMVPAPQPGPQRPPRMSERKCSGRATPAEREDATLDLIDLTAEVLADAAFSLIRSPSLSARQALALFCQTVMGLQLTPRDAIEKASVIEEIIAMQHLAKQGRPVVEAAQRAENLFSRLHPLPGLLKTAAVIAHGVLSKNHRSSAPSALTQILSAFDLDGESDELASDASCLIHEQASRQWLEPFEAAHPYVLKNYLLNRLGDRMFPSTGASGIGVELAREGLHLELVRVFLAGRAQARREAFDIGDCVDVVQAYTRYALSEAPSTSSDA